MDDERAPAPTEAHGAVETDGAGETEGAVETSVSPPGWGPAPRASEAAWPPPGPAAEADRAPAQPVGVAAWAPPGPAGGAAWTPSEPSGWETAPAPGAPIVLTFEEPRRRRMSRGAVAGWIAGVVLVIALGAGGAFAHVSAHRTADAAAGRLLAATERATAAGESLGDRAADDAFTAPAAKVMVSYAEDDLADVSARTLLEEQATAFADAVDDAEKLLSAAVPVPSIEKPFWTWEILDHAELLEEGAAALGDASRAFRSAETALEESEESLIDAALAFYATLPAHAAALEAAGISARHEAVLDLRDAAALAARQRTAGWAAADAFRAYAEKAQDLKASAEAELAEKAGPLLATRLEIEAFARSIAGGIVLDFDWAPLVNGLGGDRGMSGTATWTTARGGYSTITLSDSVAEMWPAADARALVAHEVGHAITSKCHEMFDSDDADANEAWATAWAISMGHTAIGNGVQAYGYPPQHLIDTAASCR